MKDAKMQKMKVISIPYNIDGDNNVTLGVTARELVNLMQDYLCIFKVPYSSNNTCFIDFFVFVGVGETITVNTSQIELTAATLDDYPTSSGII